METDAARKDREISEIDLALCRATLYNALALGFRPPAEETLARLVSRQGADALADAAAVLDANPGSELVCAARSLVRMEAATVMELSASFQRLFGHTARGPVPPYETEYGPEAIFQQPQELGDLTGFYRAFGLTLNTAEHERADHVSCECEFLSFLALKEAYALEQQDAPMLEETCKAARLFLRDHLGRFMPAFAKKLTREDQDGFYGALGNLSWRFVFQECTRLGVPVGPENLSLRPITHDRVPIACGDGAECPLMPGSPDAEEA
ncbi:MAG: molecular chaperone [Candidatus Binatia bacterium]